MLIIFLVFLPTGPTTFKSILPTILLKPIQDYLVDVVVYFLVTQKRVTGGMLSVN